MKISWLVVLAGTLPCVSGAWVSSTTPHSRRPIRSIDNCLQHHDQSVAVDSFASGSADVSTAQQQQHDNVLDIRIPEPRLLAVDVISVAIAVHLMAFSDVMSDPLQFAPPNPSPLPTLMQRDSLLTVCWILSALCLNGYQQETVASDLSVVRSTTRIASMFTLLRVVSSVAVAYFASKSFQGWECLLQCYMTAVTVGALRFFYGQCNR